MTPTAPETHALTSEEAEAFAREVRTTLWKQGINPKPGDVILPIIQRIASATASAEREKWRDALFPGNADTDLGRLGSTPEGAAALIREMRALDVSEERERAAKIAESAAEPLPTDEQALAGMDSSDYGYRSAAQDIAAAIRQSAPGGEGKP